MYSATECHFDVYKYLQVLHLYYSVQSVVAAVAKVTAEKQVLVIINK